MKVTGTLGSKLGKKRRRVVARLTTSAIRLVLNVFLDLILPHFQNGTLTCVGELLQ
jgi:hypothetical protein